MAHVCYRQRPNLICGVGRKGHVRADCLGAHQEHRSWQAAERLRTRLYGVAGMYFEKLDLNLLVALDALLETKSVSGAAERIGLTQPALSSALARLRQYFGDELLVQSRPRMLLTTRAEELVQPVREALVFIRSRIAAPATFDPATSRREFRITASDYAFNVLLLPVLLEAGRVAPNITFELLPVDNNVSERLDRGEVDLIISFGNSLLDNHPRQRLFSDSHAVICWDQSDHHAGISSESFCQAEHVVVKLGPDMQPVLIEDYLKQQGVQRKIALRVPSFSALAHTVIGTQRLATMYSLHANFFASGLPIKVFPMPIEVPPIQEEAQWHRLRSDDQGLRWLLTLLQKHSDKIEQEARRASLQLGRVIIYGIPNEDDA